MADISELMPDLHIAIDKDPGGDLPLGWRIALWSAMRDTFGAEAELRRNILAFAVARDLMPLWLNGHLTCGSEDYDLYSSLPPQSLDLCRRHLRGEISVETVEAQCDTMARHSNNAEYCCTGKMAYTFIAVLQLFSRILKEDDEAYEDRGWYQQVKDPNRRSEIQEALFGEMEWCETHYWASQAAAYVDDNDVYHPTPETFARRRVFWHEWVRSSVPKVLGTIDSCLAILQEP